jgi:hypothetical protein
MRSGPWIGIWCPLPGHSERLLPLVRAMGAKSLPTYRRFFFFLGGGGGGLAAAAWAGVGISGSGMTCLITYCWPIVQMLVVIQ